MNLAFFFGIFVPLCLLFLQYGLRYIITYRMTDKSLLVMLFRVVPVSRTRYEDIKEVRASFRYVESAWELFALKFGNRLWSRQWSILIRRRRRLPVVITPDDPEEFARAVRHRIRERTGEYL